MTTPDPRQPFDVADVDPDVVARQNAIYDARVAWGRAHDGQTPFDPTGHPATTDYNEHADAIEAPGEMWDDFAGKAGQIIEESRS